MADSNCPAQPGASPSQAGRGRHRVLRHAAALSGLATAAALAAACGSPTANPANSPGTGNNGSSGRNVSAATNAVVSSRRLSGIGTALVNISGMTIYTPRTPAEGKGNVKCTGPCLSFWIPVTASSASLASSRLPGKLGTIHRPDGKTQLTYNGRPLYTFRLDTAAGQAHGNNFTDSFNGTTFTWQVVTTSGRPGGAESPAPAPSYSYQPGY